MAIEICLLGPIEVRRDGVCLELGPPKRRILLLALLLQANKPVPTDRLVDTVWGQSPPPSAVANLRTYASGLRSLLVGESADPTETTRLISLDRAYAVEVGPDELDLHRFESELARARTLQSRGELAPAIDAQRAALNLWRGRAGEGVPQSDALRSHLILLEEQRVTAIEELTELLLQAGRPHEAATAIRPLVAMEPLRERACGQLMLARYRTGDQVGALAAFEAIRTALADELGVDPCPQLSALHQAILRTEPHLASRTAPVAVAVAAPPQQLPANPTILVGRATELAQMAAQVANTGQHAALISVHGMGGVGKSTLAIRFAHAVRDDYPDGQLYADLQAGGKRVDPCQILRRFLRALTQPHEYRPTDQDEMLASYRSILANRQVLMVLDNAADEAQIRPLLPTLPGSTAVITSRRALVALDGANHVPLDELTDSEAAELLTLLIGPTRAQAEPSTIHKIARLCGYLPLALRIAGARLNSRPDRPLAHLARTLTAEQHRLDELRVSDMNLRSCFHASYQELDKSNAYSAQRIFRALGAVALPTFTAATVTATTGLIINRAESVLDELTQARLLEPAGNLRYRMHDLVRIYAAEIADRDNPRTRQQWPARLCRWYATATRYAVGQFRPSEQLSGIPNGTRLPTGLPPLDAVSAVTWLEAERANIMTLGHLAAGKAHIRWFPILMARILGKYLPFRLEWQDYQTLCTLAKQAATGPSDLAYAELGLGVAACQTHNIQAGLAHLTTALNLYHAAHDDPGQITALDRIGHAHLLLHRPQNSLEYYRKALDICTRLDDNSHEARVRCNAAWAFYQLNDHATCAQYLNQALKIRQQQGDRIAEGVIRGNLGKNYLAANHFPEAIAQLTQALELSIETGNRSCEVDTLNDLYLAHQTVGNTKEGAKIKHRLAVLTTQRP